MSFVVLVSECGHNALVLVDNCTNFLLKSLLAAVRLITCLNQGFFLKWCTIPTQSQGSQIFGLNVLPCALVKRSTRLKSVFWIAFNLRDLLNLKKLLLKHSVCFGWVKEVWLEQVDTFCYFEVLPQNTVLKLFRHLHILVDLFKVSF